MTLLRLNCIRCGDMADMDPTDLRSCGLCCLCNDKANALLVSRRPWRLFVFARRWQKNQERHPTYKALVAALDNLPEPGTFNDDEAFQDGASSW
jgi:hypothetical protein